MGRLVQPPPPLRILRRHPTRRTGGSLLRSTSETSRQLSSQIRKSPDSPERFNQGDEDLLDHLHHFPHTDTRSEHASTDDHTLSHRNGSISCKGYANRCPAIPGLERADSTAT